MSNFDPDAFLNSVTTEAGTRRPPLPPGDYVATIGDIRPSAGQQRKDPSKSWHALNIPLTVDLTSRPDARALVGQDSVVLFHFVGVDVTEDGKLDWRAGRNGRLTAYRDALGMNEKGVAFAPPMMTGRQIRVKVKHDTWEGELRDAVDGVARI